MTYCISNLEGLIGRCKPPFDWMNVQTTNNVTMAIANLVSKWLRASTEETIYLNLPFRLISSIGSYKRVEHYKVALDVASFALLFFPNLWLASIAIDLFSEYVNFVRNRPLLPARKCRAMVKRKNPVISPPIWPNPETAVNAALMAATLFTGLRPTTMRKTACLHLPLRIISCRCCPPKTPLHAL